MISIYKYIFGYVCLEVVCADIGKLLSLCAKEGIHIWKIKRVDTITLKICIYEYQYNEFMSIADSLHSEVVVTSKRGVPSYFRKIKSRKFFIAGFLLFLICLYLSTSFVTEIHIEGNEKISDIEVMRILNKADFKTGKFVHNINVKEIQQEILKNNNKLSWIWIDLNGTKAYVRVKERTPLPQIADKDDYSNCVASSDGVVIEVMPRYGRQIVYPGDVVKKGDLLISGMSETMADKIRYIHADGIVTAKTWYQISGEYNHTKVERFRTGNMQKQYSINIGNVSLPIGSKNDIKYDNYDKEITNKKISDILNLSFTICTYYEIIEDRKIIDDNEVTDSAANVLANILKIQLYTNNALIQDISCSHYLNESGNVCVKVTIECVEDIAQYKSLTKPQTYPEDIDGKNNNV